MIGGDSKAMMIAPALGATTQDSEGAGRVRIRPRRAISEAMQSKRRPVADIEKEGIELRPDGWNRFREAVRVAAKSGPKHRTKATPESAVSRPKPRRTR